jgi:hypothetical protein
MFEVPSTTAWNVPSSLGSHFGDSVGVGADVVVGRTVGLEVGADDGADSESPGDVHALIRSTVASKPRQGGVAIHRIVAGWFMVFQLP